MIQARFLRLTTLAVVAVSCESLDERDILTMEGTPTVVALRLRDQTKKDLWCIRSPGVALDVVRYGEVPAGFQQIVPYGGEKPRPFVAGEVLLKITTTKGGFYVEHDCVASGPDSLRCGAWRGSRGEPRTKEHEQNECVAPEVTANHEWE